MCWGGRRRLRGSGGGSIGGGRVLGSRRALGWGRVEVGMLGTEDMEIGEAG